MSGSIFSKIVRRLKKSEKLLFIASWLYTSFYSPSTIFRRKSIKINGAFLRNVKIKVNGKNCIVTLCPKVIMNDSVISVIGDNCKVFIEGGGTNIHQCHIDVRHSNSEVIIKKGFTSEQVSMYACEDCRILVGEDCMFSSGIYVSTTDFHSVIEANTGKRLNPAKNVVIGNHVWIAHGVSILKGAIIADNIIVGKNSTVVSRLESPYSVYVGTPAKKVKEGVTWKREI